MLELFARYGRRPDARGEVGEGVEWLVLGHFTASAKRLRAADRPGDQPSGDLTGSFYLSDGRAVLLLSMRISGTGDPLSGTSDE